MLQVLQDSVNNPDLAEPFTIIRNPGKNGPSGWQAGPTQEISTYGTVGLASPKQINALPEADRIGELRLFHSSTRMFATSQHAGITADILVWRATKYRVIVAPDQRQRGYYAAIASRMAGS